MKLLSTGGGGGCAGAASWDGVSNNTSSQPGVALFSSNSATLFVVVPLEGGSGGGGGGSSPSPFSSSPFQSSSDKRSANELVAGNDFADPDSLSMKLSSLSEYASKSMEMAGFFPVVSVALRRSSNDVDPISDPVSDDPSVATENSDCPP